MDGVRINSGLFIPASEIELRFSRASGPGGQNVNKRETRVEASFDVAGSALLGPRQRARLLEALGSRLDSDGRLRVVSSEHRTQAANREAAFERLGALLAEGLRPPPPPRRKTKPSRRATERRISEKRQRGQRKRERSWRPED